MIFETSWDDASKHDVRLALLLAKYEMPATFYVPIERELDWSAVKAISYFFEIGSHTMTHPPDMKRMSDDELFFEVQTSKDSLENILGKKVNKFCYPRGRYDDRVVDAVKAAGYSDARNTLVFKTTVEDSFRKPTTIHFYPHRAEYNNRPLLALAREWLHKAKDEDGIFHLWGHSAEIEKLGLWGELEEFLNYARPFTK